MSEDLLVTSLLDDVDTSAQWIARALDSSGYRADFSPPSLRDVEQFMREHSDVGTPVEGGLLTADLGARLFALGCYVGETLRHALGGSWEADDDDPQGEINIRLHLPDGAVVWPVQRLMKRFRNGPEDSIVGYGAALGLDM
ncbi:hypothetical protein [Streptomyces sp. CoH27]|uniref:hypothetical protein n=1 Tax=Streptomyces sp. CoH27 TaxID=2875763 RepID=UPI001CD50902|nr:hypothetical protein [Streptomyces sp. CoH27]